MPESSAREQQRDVEAAASAAPPAPSISVCVSTRNRAGLLPRLLAALEAQTVGPSTFEVVIADDASTDDTLEVLRSLSERSEVSLRVVSRPRQGGPGAGRNSAWHEARSEAVAFVDDDCVPTPGWLEAHLHALRVADVTQGRVEGDPAQAHKAGPFSRVVGVPDENGLYETCNICYRREWLEKTGGFDASFRRSGEDADLAWRAKAMGATTTFVREALVYHDVEPSSWPRALRDTLRWSGVVLLVERHPNLRRRFGEGPTWRSSHAPAALAAGGILLASGALATRRYRLAAAAAAALVPYLRHRLVKEPVGGSRSASARALGPQLLIDLSELCVILGTRARLRLGSSSGGRASGLRRSSRVPPRQGPGRPSGGPS